MHYMCKVIPIISFTIIKGLVINQWGGQGVGATKWEEGVSQVSH